MRWRSMLFAPASEPAKAIKAAAGDADQVALDLEAAVPAALKQRARELLDETLPGLARRPWVRVNDLATAEGEADLAGLQLAQIAGVIVPLIGTREELLRAAQLVAEREGRCGLAPGTVPLMATIETCRAFVNLGEIAAADCQRELRLNFGAWDFTLDSGIAYTRAEEGLGLARQQVVVHSRAAGLPAPLDASYPYLDDADGYEASCLRVRALGLGGKACIHPAQVEPANRIFQPSAGELERAVALVEAFETAASNDQAAIRFRGEFVDRPMYDQAKRILESVPEKP